MMSVPFALCVIERLRERTNRNVCRHIRNIHDKDPEDFEIKTEIQVQPTKKRGREEWDKSVSEVEPKKKRARNVKNKGAI